MIAPDGAVTHAASPRQQWRVLFPELLRGHDSSSVDGAVRAQDRTAPQTIFQHRKNMQRNGADFCMFKRGGRMDPMMGQVGLIPHGTSWIAKAIQKITRSDTCHAIIHIGNGYTIGAEPGGAKIRPIEAWPTAVWSRFELTDAQAYSCADWAKQYEDYPYAYLDDALLGLEYAFNFRWPKFITKHLSSDKQWMCSELADAALTLGAGITVFDDGREFCEVAPGDFQQLFTKNGWWPFTTDGRGTDRIGTTAK